MWWTVRDTEINVDLSPQSRVQIPMLRIRDSRMLEKYIRDSYMHHLRLDQLSRKDADENETPHQVCR